MEKLIYGVWRAPDADGAEVADVLVGTVAPALHDTGTVRGARVLSEAPEAAAFRWGQADDGWVLAGGVAVWLDTVDDRDLVEDLLAEELPGCRVHGWLVSESTALGYPEPPAPPGERSPGVAILTFFPKRDGLTDEEFFAVWHGEQTPMSFELHPITLYLRNTVVRPLTPGCPDVRGIVEECVGSVDELLDPMRFYSAADQADLDDRLARSMALHDRFTDMARLQTMAAAEHLVKVVSS